MNVKIKNLGPIKETEFKILPFTLIAGVNQTGKSFLIRGIYSVLRGIYEANLEKANNVEKIIERKIKWVFQQERIGSLVNKFQSDEEMFSEINGVSITIARKDIKRIKEIKVGRSLIFPCSVHFLSSPVVMDIEKALATYRDSYKKNYGVQDVYWDLLRDIRNIGLADEPELEDIRRKIHRIIDGRFSYDPRKGFIFIKKRKEIPAFLTAFGIKIFGILQLLIERDLLKSGSYLFFEEPENHLHPGLQISLIDILTQLLRKNVNIIISTHSPEIVRYTEHLFNVNQLSPENSTFVLMNFDGETTFAKAGNDINILLNILESLTEPYYEITLRDMISE